MQSIKNTHTSKYLKTLLHPASGACHIPDDIVTRCSLRSETVTYNITAPASGQGIFTFFPNSPLGLVGYHYVYDSALNEYVADTTTGFLITAQNLNQNFNYSRLVSQLLTVRSSTLPAGVYALNGTFNAITYDGCVSEANLPVTQYGQLLSLNSDTIDKVGNVLVGDGVAILSLPNRFDVNFCRMNDAAPAIGNSTAAYQSSIVDATATLNYEMQFSPIAIGAFPAFGTTLAGMNVDNVRSVTVSGSFTITNISRHNSVNCVQYSVAYLDFAGGVIYNDIQSTSVTINPNYVGSHGEIGGGSFEVFSMLSAVLKNGKPLVPVASVSFSILDVLQPNVSGWSTSEIGLPSMHPNTLKIEATSAAFPGLNSPVTLLAYQGLAAGSVLTLSGVTNFELIPNPQLKKNLPTSYGKHDPAELDYVKMVLANREELGIRTVYPLPEYKLLLSRLEEFYNLDSNTYAEAFDWGKLLKMIKNVAIPGLSAAFPQYSPLIGMGGQLADDLLKAYGASGTAIAASGTPIARSSTVTPGTDIVSLRTYALDNWDVVDIKLENMTYGSQMLYTKKLYIGGDESTASPPRGVLFPTITMRSNTLMSHMMYIAVPGNWSTYLPYNVRANYSETANGRRVWGIANTYLGHIMTNQDITLLPILSIQGGYAVIPDEAPILEGTSCVTAILAADRGKFYGIPPVAVTGNAKFMEGRYITMPNPAVNMKRQAAEQMGLKFIGAGIEGPVMFVSNVIDELTGMETKNKVFTTVKNDVDYSNMTNKAADDAMEQWKNLSQSISQQDPEFKKLIELVNWINRNELTDMLYNYASTDPDGNRLYKVVAPLTQVFKPTNPDSKSPYQAQREKAERIARNLSLQYGDAFNPEWVETHGYRGPTSEEIRAMTAQVAKPEKLEAIIAASIKNNGGDKLTPDQKANLETSIRTKGKGLSPTELADALGRTGGATSSKAEVFIKNSGITDENLKEQIRAAIAAKSGKGLSADELRQLTGVSRVVPRKSTPAIRSLLNATSRPQDLIEVIKQARLEEQGITPMPAPTMFQDSKPPAKMTPLERMRLRNQYEE